MAMSVVAIQHLMVEACEPLLQPTRSRCELFRQSCQSVGLRDFPDKAVMSGFMTADARFGGLPRPLATWNDEISFWTSYYGEVLASLGQSPPLALLQRLVQSLVTRQSVAVHPALPGIVGRVGKSGGRVILVADWYVSFRQTLINSGLLGLFPEIFLAGQQGIFLEDQSGLLVMLRTLGLRAETVTFLGVPRAALSELGITCCSGDHLESLPFTG